MWRTMRLAACALTATLALSGIALAQYDRDRDDGFYRRDSGPSQQYGYQNGYNDGVNNGRHEGRERDPHDYQTPDWRKATHGYKGWMGSKDAYASSYRDGYRSGFRAGYDEVAGSWHGGRGSYGWQSEGWRNGYDAGGENVADRVGYQDGAEAAREDIYHRKEYNSKPRGRFGGRDDGYRREFGSKDRYKDEYTAGYRAGYDSVMRRY
jgi:hypothetical protein